MQIVLVRHGVPACDPGTRVRGCDYGAWVRAYDEAALAAASTPPPSLLALASAMSCLVTSTLRRSIESAALLAPGRDTVRDGLFDEAGVPTALRTRIALRPQYWDVVTRTAWLLGWSPGVETLAATSARAARAAQRLHALAQMHGSVMLVGHGMLNTLIARALRRDRWRGSGSPRRYWGSVTLRPRDHDRISGGIAPC